MLCLLTPPWLAQTSPREASHAQSACSARPGEGVVLARNARLLVAEPEFESRTVAICAVELHGFQRSNNARIGIQAESSCQLSQAGCMHTLPNLQLLPDSLVDPTTGFIGTFGHEILLVQVRGNKKAPGWSSATTFLIPKNLHRGTSNN